MVCGRCFGDTELDWDAFRHFSNSSVSVGPTKKNESALFPFSLESAKEKTAKNRWWKAVTDSIICPF